MPINHSSTGMFRSLDLTNCLLIEQQIELHAQRLNLSGNVSLVVNAEDAYYKQCAFSCDVLLELVIKDISVWNSLEDTPLANSEIMKGQKKNINSMLSGGTYI